jgi:hypothetical protein
LTKVAKSGLCFHSGGARRNKAKLHVGECCDAAYLLRKATHIATSVTTQYLIKVVGPEGLVLATDHRSWCVEPCAIGSKVADTGDTIIRDWKKPGLLAEMQHVLLRSLSISESQQSAEAEEDPQHYNPGLPLFSCRVERSAVCSVRSLVAFSRPVSHRA